MMTLLPPSIVTKNALFFILYATLLLLLLTSFANAQTLLQTASSTTTCSGNNVVVVSGPFLLSDIKGTCSYAKILDEYTNQVFNAAGATSTSCAAAAVITNAGSIGLTAKQDLDGKLLAAMPDATNAEEAAMQLCKAMYDSAEIT